MSDPQSSVDDVLQVEEVLQRIASDLSMIADRSLSVDSVEAERSTTRSMIAR